MTDQSIKIFLKTVAELWAAALQAATAEAEAKYLPVIERLVEALEELTSIENNEELGGVWSKTHWQTAETGESVYEARLTRKEIAKFRESLALAKPLLEKKEEV